MQKRKKGFNSRPHEEVDIRQGVLSFLLQQVSTHDLTKRSTGPALTPCQWQKSFNSRPHEEVDSSPAPPNPSPTVFQLTTSRRGRRYSVCRYCSDWHVSTHDLTKRSTSSVLSSSSLLMFQLTTSRRGRPSSLSCKNDSMSFQLTTSRRGRPNRL